jgi:hypothetical protein
MTPQELAYYLQGFFEITDAKILTPEQVAKIRAKVQSCFQKVTPDRPVYASYFSKAINDPNLTPKKEEPFYSEYPAVFTEDQVTGTDIPPLFRDRPFANPFEGAPACASSEGQFISC